MQATVAEAVNTIPVTLKRSIGKCVRAWREYRRLRPSDLAEKAQVTRSYISSLEHNAIKNPNDEHLIRIADALGIDVMVLFTRQLPPDSIIDIIDEQESSTNSNEINIHRSPVTLGTEIERKLRTANLSDQELKVIADSLLSVTDQMLGIVNATR
jgi:transcriptional regulator with XRE-family HTH domain